MECCICPIVVTRCPPVPDLVRSGAPAARPALARRLALCGVLSLATLAAAAAPPILDNIPDQTVIQDHPTDGLLLGIQDSDTPLLALQLSGTSSNPGLVSQENI